MLLAVAVSVVIAYLGIKLAAFGVSAYAGALVIGLVVAMYAHPLAGVLTAAALIALVVHVPAAHIAVGGLWAAAIGLIVFSVTAAMTVPTAIAALVAVAATATILSRALTAARI